MSLGNMKDYITTTQRVQ